MTVCPGSLTRLPCDRVCDPHRKVRRHHRCRIVGNHRSFLCAFPNRLRQQEFPASRLRMAWRLDSGPVLGRSMNGYVSGGPFVRSLGRYFSSVSEVNGNNASRRSQFLSDYSARAAQDLGMYLWEMRTRLVCKGRPRQRQEDREP